jgi:hypothetical protein
LEKNQMAMDAATEKNPDTKQILLRIRHVELVIDFSREYSSSITV